MKGKLSVMGWATWASGVLWACGPFFPDSVLDDPDAVFKVPPVSYLHELSEFAGTPVPESMDSGVDLLAQIPHEIAELEAVWKPLGVPDEEIESRSRDYRIVRTALLKILIATERRDGSVEKLPVPDQGLDDRFPRDVVDYVEGARLLAAGRRSDARAIWKDIVERPAAEQRLRGVWAAWMLGRTAADMEEAVRWYRRVIQAVEAGGQDVLGLEAAAFGWLATLDCKDRPLEAIRLGFRAYQGGQFRAAVDLRWRCGELLRSNDQELLNAAAEDDTVRCLVNLHLHAIMGRVHSEPVEAGEESPLSRWLCALEAVGPEQDPGALEIAWALYGSGRFEESAAWLKRADESDSRTAWLRGKLALRAGRIDEARDELAGSLEQVREAEDWNPGNPLLNTFWHRSVSDRRSARQGRLLTDVALAELAQGDYARALGALVEADYWADAAYIAERVLSSDELREQVRMSAPEWSPEILQLWSGEEVQTRYGGSYVFEGAIDPANCFKGSRPSWGWKRGGGDGLRYLLARRFAREWRFDDAREWMPLPLVALFDHYVSLHRARLSGRYQGEDYAVIAWRQARIHRHLGAELFGTEGAPDGGARSYYFMMGDVARLRAHWSGVRPIDADDEIHGGWSTVPKPSLVVRADEARRSLAHALPEERQHRFHYRYLAADIAWKAGAALPRNHPRLATLYNTAGMWLAPRDPEAADRFYQAMVRRCAETEAGKRADTKRWFLSDLRPLEELGKLPEELVPAPLTPGPAGP